MQGLGRGKIGLKCFSRLLLVVHGRKPSKPHFHGPIKQRRRPKKPMKIFLNFTNLRKNTTRTENCRKFSKFFEKKSVLQMHGYPDLDAGYGLECLKVSRKDGVPRGLLNREGSEGREDGEGREGSRVILIFFSISVSNAVVSTGHFHLFHFKFSIHKVPSAYLHIIYKKKKNTEG